MGVVRVVGAELGSSCLPTAGEGTSWSDWVTSLARRMQTKVPRLREYPAVRLAGQIVLIKVEIL